MAPKIVLLMRHAEKPFDPTDPDLSPEGLQRAAKLPAWIAQELGGKPDYIFAAAVSPHSRRPIETMEPLSRWSGVSINSTIAGQDYSALAADLLRRPIYDMKCAVICWHHGHIPSFAEDLGAIVGNYPNPWPLTTFELMPRFDWALDGSLSVRQLHENF